MSDIVERLNRVTLYDGAGELSALPEEAADEITALRAENVELVEALRWIVDKYDEALPMRAADFHIPECTCMRCARDNASAILEKSKA